ncbi:hypothetical protein BU26DRAFT_598597 [Trematosphaeria pertusa]|uniref:Zn(2)-C6 fungal-type domain-containing protein n=1 Tax=Trematosphaeria pertusa TaxID=390896 RepID=A0A6A6J0Q0_9PLEO|nr:uncharacterized protein BU26DRAFT_598597 [Trematosphaeria pertusa]KAF2255742.1 hypothetical protein BU26DRAFT_598597 [Trematosphaeria pertusa]
MRKVHSKSRNSCLRCKQRRVKCDLQAPICSNCTRRKENCEWPSWATAFTENQATISAYSAYPLAPSPLRMSLAADVSAGFPYLDLGVRACLANTLSAIPFSGNEVALWGQSLAKPASKFQYLQPALFSLVSLYSERYDPQNVPHDRSLAYRQHLDATTLFRNTPPVVNEENWSAVLIFGLAVVVFQFATQQTCPDAAFDYMETLHVLRMSANLAREVFPFLSKSSMWPFIQHRVRLSMRPPDPRAQAAIKTLEDAVLSYAVLDDDQEARIRGLNAFKDWVVDCDGYPRVWRHYIQWPRSLRNEFLLLLLKDDDIALLILIHWCVFLHLSPNRWWLELWPRRTAASAMSKFTQDWEALAWPKTVFALPGCRDER